MIDFNFGIFILWFMCFILLSIIYLIDRCKYSTLSMMVEYFVCSFIFTVKGGFFSGLTFADPDGHLIISSSLFDGDFLKWLSLFKADAFFYSWLVSPLVFYFNSINAVIVINMLLVSLSMYVFNKVYKIVWCEHSFFNNILLILFPSLIFFTLDPTVREIALIFFILLGFFNVLLFERDGEIKNFIFFVFFISLSAFLHTAFALIFFGYFVYRLLSKPSFTNYFFVFILAFMLFYLFSQGLFSDKFNLLEKAGDVNTLQSWGAIGRASYPNYLMVNSNIEGFFLFPIRLVAYFSLPFFWMIHSVQDFLGFIDGLFYIFIISRLIKYRELIKHNKFAVLLVFLFIFSLFAFSYITSNYGALIRHRIKFYFFILLLFPPKIQVRFFK